MADKDLYSILGVSRDAGPAEIKKRYRQLARKYHPDVNPGDVDAEDTFKEISAAFDILGDAEKRKRYDEFGMEGLREGFDPEKARAYKRWTESARRGGGYEWREASPDFGDFADLGSVFGDLFGGRFRGRPSGPRRGGNIEAGITIDFLTAVRGGEVNLSLERPQICPSCDGTGRQGGSGGPCRVCGGSGHQRVDQGPININMPCEHCGGSGREPGPTCPECRGSGAVPSTSDLKVKIPAGIEDGGRIRLAGQGSPGREGGKPGDLLLRVKVKPHSFIERDGHNLTMRVPVTVGEALLGGRIDLPVPDGGTVTLTIPKGSQNGRKLRLKGKGAPDPKGGPPGDLYVILDVRLPTAASAQVEEIARKLDSHYDQEAKRPERL